MHGFLKALLLRFQYEYCLLAFRWGTSAYRHATTEKRVGEPTSFLFIEPNGKPWIVRFDIRRQFRNLPSFNMKPSVVSAGKSGADIWSIR